MEAPFIDIHHHVIGKNSPSAALAPGWSMERDEESLDRLGVAGALLSLPVSTSPHITRELNEYLAQMATHNSTRYGMLACLPSGSVDAALEELDFAVGTLHADGVCLPSNAGGVYIGDDQMNPILEELSRRSAAVLLHPSRPSVVESSLVVNDMSVYEFPFDTTRAMMDYIYRGKIRKFPGIRWIVSHAGGVIPYLAYRLSTVASEGSAIALSEDEVVSALKSLYYDLALSTDPGVFDQLKNLVGPTQILWGTDAPLRPEAGIRRGQEILCRYSGFDDLDLRLVQSGVAKALFPRFH